MMTVLSERNTVLGLVADAVLAGARQESACDLISLIERTLQRWKIDQVNGTQDGRPTRL